MAKIYQENQELFRILTWGALIFLGIAATIYLIWLGLRPDPTTLYYDKITELELDSLNTGAIKDTVTFVGLETVNEADTETITQASYIIQKYVVLMYPSVTKLSVERKSIKQDGDKSEFKLVSDTGESFVVNLTKQNNGRIVFDLSDKNNQILHYDSGEVRKSYQHPLTLGARYLPKTIRNDEIEFSITQNKDESYQINVNSCGDQEIKTKAVYYAQEWIKSLGFNPEDITFKIPTFCDGQR